MRDTACKIEGCNHAVDRRGYCTSHYMRAWRRGDALAEGPSRKPCKRCGEVFLPATNRAVYCSLECRQSKAICEKCGVTFVITSGSNGRFCSRACWYVLDRASKPCPVCETPFKGQSKTCSTACGGTLRKMNNPSRVGHCEECGGEMPPGPASRRFCSRTCAMKFRANSQGGRTRPLGSLTPHGSGYVLIKTEAGWKMQHRVVVENQIGRPLLPHERVHHKNGQRDDNRPENLELWRIKGKDPAGVRATDYHCPGCRCGR